MEENGLKTLKVFLGGTCNGSEWRKEIKNYFCAEVDYFDPVVPDWNEEAQDEERRQRAICNICLYVLTPKMAGFYSIAEVVQDSMKKPERTMLCILDEDGDARWTKQQAYSLQAVSNMVFGNGATTTKGLKEAASKINSFAKAFTNWTGDA